MSKVNIIVLTAFAVAIVFMTYVIATGIQKTQVSRAFWIKANRMCYVTGVDSSGTFHCDNGWRIKMQDKGVD